MKKILSILMVLILSTTMFSCSSNKYQIPDIIGMQLNDAKLLIAGQVSTEASYEYSNEYLPNTVIGFLDNLEVNDMINKNKTLNIVVAKAPEGSFSHSTMIDYVFDLGYVTGPDSQNFDLLRESGVGSTDLGIPFTVNDKLVFLYGDTFSGTENMSGFWKSNFIAISEDTNFDDGLLFSSLVTSSRNIITPFAEGLHQRSVSDEESDNPLREVTKIPTGGIQVGDDVYIFYMSVRYWGSHGAWGVSYNQAVKTDVNFTDFQEVQGLRWNEELANNFGQIYPFENSNDPDYIYFVSIPGGRYGGVALFRVLKTEFEDFESYEYYLGNDTWESGTSGLEAFKANPFLIIQSPCSELSIMYNSYLNKWMIVYLKNYGIVFHTADTLTSEWSSPEIIVTGNDFGGLYGGFVSPQMTRFDGKKFYIQLSRWLPIYQTQLIEVVLK